MKPPKTARQTANNDFPMRIEPLGNDELADDALALAMQVRLYMTENNVTGLSQDFELEMLVPDYLESADGLTDPWGSPYLLRMPGDGRDFDIVSYGEDKVEGGTENNADVVHGKK